MSGTTNEARGARAALACAAALVATLALAAAPAPGRAATSCGPAVSYLVWPHGHPGLPALGFGPEPVPHVDVVSGSGPRLGSADLVGWVTAGPSAHRSSPSTYPWCVGFTNPIGSARRFRTTRGAVRLVCRYPDTVRFTTRRLSATRQELRTQLGDGTLVAIALAAPTGTSVRFDARYCDSHPAPRPTA